MASPSRTLPLAAPQGNQEFDHNANENEVDPQMIELMKRTVEDVMRRDESDITGILDLRPLSEYHDSDQFKLCVLENWADRGQLTHPHLNSHEDAVTAYQRR